MKGFITCSRYTQRTSTPYWTHHPHNRENEYEYIHEHFNQPEGATSIDQPHLSSPPVGMVHPMHRSMASPPYGYNESALGHCSTSLPRLKPSVFHKEIQNPPPEGPSDPREYFTLDPDQMRGNTSFRTTNVDLKR